MTGATKASTQLSRLGSAGADEPWCTPLAAIPNKSASAGAAAARLDEAADQPRTGPSFEQTRLVLLGPAEECLNRSILASILVVHTDVVPPRLDAAGEAVEHPHARGSGRPVESSNARTRFVQ